MELVQDFVHDFDQDFDKISHQKECKKASGGLPGASGKLQKGFGGTVEAPVRGQRAPGAVLKNSRSLPESSRRIPRGSRGVLESFRERLGGPPERILELFSNNLRPFGGDSRARKASSERFCVFVAKPLNSM